MAMPKWFWWDIDPDNLPNNAYQRNKMKAHSVAPLDLFRSLKRNRLLVGALIKREVLGRYKGSALGLLWSFFNPILMLIIYTFVFSVVFKARWGVQSESKTEFALMLFAGLIVYNLFAECVNKAPSSILSNPNYVTKVIFPLEMIVVVNLGSALFHFLVSLAVWVIAYLVFFGIPHATMLLAPLVLAPLLVAILGISWFLSSLGVYLRDVSQVVGVLTSVLMFLSPIFYPISALPEKYRGWLEVNPLTVVIENMRLILFMGLEPNYIDLTKLMIVSLILLFLGYAWFQKTRKGFGDVL